jgi:hypothetical protein
MIKPKGMSDHHLTVHRVAVAVQRTIFKRKAARSVKPYRSTAAASSYIATKVHNSDEDIRGNRGLLTHVTFGVGVLPFAEK